MAIWSKLVPATWAERFDDFSLDRVKELPLYVKLGTGAVILGLLTWYLNSRDRKRNLPPGPWGFPFIGAVHQLRSKMHEDCVRLRGVYGDIFSFKLSTSLWVIVNGYPAIKEAFIKNAEDFAGRPLFGFDELLSFKDPFFMADYNDRWKANKKFAVVSLRHFGFGSPRLEPKILEEISQMIEKVKTLKGEGVDLVPYMKHAMARVIMHITISGHRDPTDEETEELSTLCDRFVTDNSFNDIQALVMFAPLWIAKRLAGKTLEEFDGIAREFTNYIKARLIEHKETLDPENPRDAMDMYISKRLDKDMTEEEVLHSLLMFLPDAIGTLSGVVSLDLLYITYHPEVQEKIHEELDRVVGKSGPVTFEHKARLPYLQAVLLETDRIALLTPLAAPHKAMTDATLLGYDIPKDTVIAPNLYSVHYDEKIFPNPHKFDPGHFLDDKGEIKNAEYCIPFSVGRRMCLGEALAKLEKFLFVANLYKEFSTSFPPEEPNPSLEPTCFSGIFFLPKPFKLCLVPRV